MYIKQTKPGYKIDFLWSQIRDRVNVYEIRDFSGPYNSLISGLHCSITAVLIRQYFIAGVSRNPRVPQKVPKGSAKTCEVPVKCTFEFSFNFIFMMYKNLLRTRKRADHVWHLILVKVEKGEASVDNKTPGGARSVIVSVAGYGHGDTSSNPGPD